MLVAYGIPSQENPAKEGLTPHLKLHHFLTLHKKHISFSFIKKNTNKLNLLRHHELHDFP